MDRPAQRRILLGLLSGSKQPDLSQLLHDDWIDIDGLAGQHRLQPLLFGQHRDNPAIPDDIRTGWQAAHRLTAMQALVWQAELEETCDLLREFAPVALKGAWLAAHSYPSPALRPLRDLDLLVAEADVLKAYDVLLAAGYTPGAPAEFALEDIVRIDKHLPPLIAPRGTVIELHHRLWEPQGRLDHASPVRDEAAVLAAAVTVGSVRYPAATDLLTHLIVHAVYSHRLDCGPLILSDLRYLLAAAQPDWARFWGDAAAQGWRDGARLLLDLSARYYPETRIDLSADSGEPTPARIIESTPDLLLQELDTRKSARFAAATLIGGPARLVQRVIGRHKIDDQPAAVRDVSAEGGRIGWVGSRVVRSIGDLARRDVRRQSRQLAALSKWLDR